MRKLIFWGTFGLFLTLMIRGVMAQGTAVPFVDVTEAAGITAPIRQGREKITGQTWADYDQDGWPDFYVTDTDGANVLYRNNGDGSFSISPLSDSVVLPDALSGGALFADYDNDGRLDLFFSNAGPMTLLRNQGDEFADVAESAGERFPQGIGWGSVFLDYDNDGWQDLYLAVSDPADGKSDARNPLFRNNGDGTFTDLGPASGAADPGRSTGVAAADYDRDGRVDLLVGNFDQGYRLYRNQSEAANWVSFHLVGGGAVNRDGIGARMYLTATDGRTQMQEVICGSGVGGSNMLDPHFGLGDAEVAEISVRWPDGAEETAANLTVNQIYTLNYGRVAELTPAGFAYWPEVALFLFLLVGLFLVRAAAFQ